MLVHSIWCNVCLLLLCVFLVSEFFKICLVDRSSFFLRIYLFLQSNSLSLRSRFHPESVRIFSFKPKSILSVSCPSSNLYKLFRKFSGLFHENNLIFRCSILSYNALQILYLDSSCSIISLRIFPEFLELSEYFSWLNY